MDEKQDDNTITEERPDTEQRVLRRTDMIERGALTKLQERGALTGDIGMGQHRGGATFQNMLQVMEFAKLMAVSDVAVPKHLRGNPGACLRIVMQADAWGMEPFAVADKSYSVNDRLAYESQLIHALIERRAPLEKRLRPHWTGEGPTRKCIVTGWAIGETDPFVWDGQPEIAKIKVKNSPEWSNNPDKQLFYHASRDWARIFFPDVLLGVYSREEMAAAAEEAHERARGPETIQDRLPPPAGGEGFDADGIATTLKAAAEPAEGASDAKPQRKVRRTAADEERSDAADAAGSVETVQEGGALGGLMLKEPETGAEYVAYAQTWIGKVADPEERMGRWEGEKELRAKCRLPVVERKRLEKLAKGETK